MKVDLALFKLADWLSSRRNVVQIIERSKLLMMEHSQTVVCIWLWEERTKTRLLAKQRGTKGFLSCG